MTPSSPVGLAPPPHGRPARHRHHRRLVRLGPRPRTVVARRPPTRRSPSRSARPPACSTATSSTSPCGPTPASASNSGDSDHVDLPARRHVRGRRRPNPLNGNCPANGVSSSSEASAQLFAVADGSRAEGDIAVGVGVAEWTLGVRTAELHARVRSRRALPPRGAGRHEHRSGGGPVDRPLRHPGAHVRDPRPDGRVRQQEPGGGVDGGVGPHAGPVGALDAGAVRLRGASGRRRRPSRPTGEGEGLAGLRAADSRDLAYTARGIPAVDGLDPAPQRAAVYTPVALNAVVIAAIGGGQVVTDDPALAGRASAAVRRRRSA